MKFLLYVFSRQVNTLHLLTGAILSQVTPHYPQAPKQHEIQINSSKMHSICNARSSG